MSNPWKILILVLATAPLSLSIEYQNLKYTFRGIMESPIIKKLKMSLKTENQ
jgi:hypothetical protein